MLAIDWHGEQLHLLPQRAVYWSATQTLWVADPHFGKDASFRRAGIPVPQASLQDDLQRLEACLRETGAERLMVLGDFWHARSGRTDNTLAALSAWRQQHKQLACVLLRGNHDQHAGDPPDEWAFACEEELLQGPFRLQHHPPTGADPQITVCGHVHPGYMLNGMRVPCFYFGAQLGLLPAFGGFTGLKMIRPGPDEAVYLVTPDAVIPGPRPRRQINT